MKTSRVTISVLLCALCVGMSAAQVTRAVPAADTVAAGTGTILLADSAHAAPPQPKSTTTALLLSAALPGAGQAYNGSYWKVPIVVGLGAYFIAELVDNNKKYRSYRDQYTASQTLVNPSGDRYLLKLRDFYGSNRDTYVWYFVILYVLNLADAYVDASLSGFDVGGNLSFRALPAPAVQFRLRLP